MTENNPGAQPGKCQRCGIHDATRTVYYWNNQLEEWCACCEAFRDLKRAEEEAAQIPELRRALAASCDKTGKPPREIPHGWCVQETAHRSGQPSRKIFWAQDMRDLMAWLLAHPEQPGTTRAVGCRCRRPDGLQPSGTITA